MRFLTTFTVFSPAVRCRVFSGFLIGLLLPAFSVEAGSPKLESLPMLMEENLGQASAEARFYSRGAGFGFFLTERAAVLTLHQGQNNSNWEVVRMEWLGGAKESLITGESQSSTHINQFVGPTEKWRKNIPAFGKVRYSSVYPGIDLVFYGNQRNLEYDFELSPGADAGRIAVRWSGNGESRITSNGDLEMKVGDRTVRQHKPVAYQDTAAGRVYVETAFQEREKGVYGFALGAYDATRQLTIDPVLSYSTFFGSSGPNEEHAYDIAVDASGSAYITGLTASTTFPLSAAYQTTLRGSYDAFVAKFNANGNALVYSTYIGGTENDQGISIAVDAANNAYVTGLTRSADFPVTPGTLKTVFGETPGAGADTWVTKFSADGGTLIYSTYLGGSGADFPARIAVDGAGQAHVTGQTDSPNFHITSGAVQPTALGGRSDGFVAKLNATGRDLVYSSYLGGAHPSYYAGGEESVTGIALTSLGEMWLTGYTTSGNFPTTPGAFQPSLGGYIDAFVTKLRADGSLAYSTFLGGNANDQGVQIAVDTAGNAYVAGFGESAFPTLNALQPLHGGGRHDVVVMKFSSSGTLLYSTFLGGNGEDYADDIVAGPDGSARVSMHTSSNNLPLVQPIQSGFAGGALDAYVAAIAPAGNSLQFSTYLGGGGDDIPYGMAQDTAGNLYIAGMTGSTNFPLAAPLQTTFGGGSTDAFVAKIVLVSDATQPSVTPSITPAPNLSGWNNSDVTVSWVVADPESGIASSTGCGTVTLTTNTTGTLITCTATNGAGLSRSASVTVRIDKSAPASVLSYYVSALTKSDIANGQIDQFVNPNDRVVSMHMGFKPGNSTLKGDPVFTAIGADGTRRQFTLSTVPAGFQMWEATVDMDFVGWSVDGRYVIVNLQRYGSTMLNGVAGRFAVAYPIYGCAVGTNCRIGFNANPSILAPSSAIVYKSSPSRPAYLTGGLSSASAIDLQPNGSYLVAGRVAAGNLYQGNGLPPLATDAGPGTYPLYWPESSYRQVVLQDSPLGYWRLGETPGTASAANSGTLGSSSNATLQGGVQLGAISAIPGDNNAAGFFNGTSAYLSVADRAQLQFGASFTFEAWIKRGSSSGYQAILGKQRSPGEASVNFLVEGNSLYLSMILPDPRVVSVNAIDALLPGQYNHVVGTNDGTALRLYVNGQQVAATFGVYVPVSNAGFPLYIGSEFPTGSTYGPRFLDGSIDEVAVYGAALPAARILAHYNEGIRNR